MEKRLLFLALSAATTLTVAADELYHSTFNTEAEVAGWTIIDANNDATTWRFSATNDAGSRFYYSYHSSNAGNDWAISPAVTPTADGKLLIKYTVKGSAYGENIKVYTGSEATVDALQANLKASHLGLGSTATGGYFILDAKAGEPLHVGFYACSDADKWRLYLQELSISTLDGDPVDLALTQIVSPSTGDYLTQEAVSVVIKNNSEVDASGFSVSFTTSAGQSVTEQVGSTLAAGAEMTYTFQTKADLSTTGKLYTVTATVSHPNDINTSNNTATTSVRNYADATVPYKMGFESSEDTSRIKFFNLNGDDGKWSAYSSYWYNFARTGSACIKYNYNKDNDANDWAILEPIHVEKGTYALKFWVSGSEGHTEKLRVCYGTDATPEAMTTLIVDRPDIVEAEYVEVISFFEVAETQTIYLGFHCYSDKNENWITVDDISLEQIDPNAADIAISSLTAPGDYLPKADYKRVTFTIQNVALVDADVTVKILVDDQQIYSTKEYIRAQEKKELSYDGVLSSVAVGKHTVKVVVDEASDTNLDNNTLSASVTVLGEPSVLYDFEDGQVPSTFVFYTNDDGVINNSAIDEWGTTGWAPFQIEQHTLYGKYMLGATTWVDLGSSTQLDRICVLPSVTVDSDDACVVWNVGSLNENYPISYRFMINDGTWGNILNNRYYYDDVKVVAKQDHNRVNAGASLAKYKGKTVTPAIHIYGTPGDALAFDNIQFHGCTSVATGIKQVAASTTDGSIDIRISADQLLVKSTGEVAAVEICDLSGRLIKRSTSAIVSIADLTPGTYVAKVATANGRKVAKFVK